MHSGCSECSARVAPLIIIIVNKVSANCKGNGVELNKYQM